MDKVKEDQRINVSNDVVAEFEKFKAWHFELKKSLDKLKLSDNEELELLNEILPKHKAAYFEKIRILGLITKNYTKIQKKLFFNIISKSGLHEILKGAPYFYHSIFKPRGYPGDAEMMSLVYRNDFEGTDLFSKLMHKIGTDCDACVAIRNRKSLLHDSFFDLKEGKVLSLAAGPAQEIYEYTEKLDNLDFLALDHDIETLKNASKNNRKLGYGIINAFHLIKGNKRYLVPRGNRLNRCNPKKDTKGIKQLLLPLKYSVNNLKDDEFDLIYSAGLFDYIKTFEDQRKGTIALTKELFDSLKPGGRMLIGNISPELSIGVKWAMECLCDWYLIHRTKEEVLQFASSIPKDRIASIDVVSEETGVNWFLDIKKN